HLTLLLGVLATAYSLYHISDLRFEWDFRKLKPEVETTGPEASLPDKLKETRSPAIVLTESRAEAMAVVAEVERIRTERGDSSTVLSVQSVYSFLPADQEQKLDLITDLQTMIDTNIELLDQKDRSRVDSLRQYFDVQELALTDLPREMTKSFSSKEGEILNFVQINASVPLRDGRNSINFAREVKVIETELGTFYASSSHIIFAEMLELMLDDAVIAVIVTLLVVGVVLVIDLGSILSAALVLTPLLTALAWVTGLMYVFDFRINIYNMVAFPTIIGMGIDNAVHIFHRYREA
ncbi:uncharacterized protein METZ01_LOCUS385984, partial [marine metagenome]